MNDIKKDRLPEYMQIVKVLLDIYDLNQFLAKIQDTTTDNLINEGAIRQYNSQYNKLKDSVEPYVANI